MTSDQPDKVKQDTDSSRDQGVLAESARSLAYEPSSVESAKTTFNENKNEFQKNVLPELADYHSSVDKLFDKFARRGDLPADSKIHIIDSLTKMVQGKGLESTGISDPAKRRMLAAGIIDNLGDPHGIDQGSFPTCTTAAAEEQHYTAQGGDNPASTVYIVEALADIALSGRLKENHPFRESEKYTNLDQSELEPDWEARRDQGTNDYRNYASQIYHTVERKDSLSHTELENRFAVTSPELSASERVSQLQKHLEEHSSVTVGADPISRFNQVMAGSEPFYKSVGHAVNIYRQKNDFGLPAYASGEPLYFLSDQRGRELDRKNLTRVDLQKIFEQYPADVARSAGAKGSIPEALPGEESRRDYYFNRLKDLTKRALEMRRLGERKDEY